MRKSNYYALYIRSLSFYGVTLALIFFHSILSLFVCPLLPENRRHSFITKPIDFIIWWLNITCKIRFNITGIENITQNQAVIILCNHQSSCETIFLQTLVSPMCTVMKKEMKYMPFLGWILLRLMDPITIDRSRKVEALRKLISKGKEKLKNNIPVLIFPEGTFFSPGTPGTFTKGGAAIAALTGYPIVPIAHNAGKLWHDNTFLRTPGTIDFVIGPPIYTKNLSTQEVNERSTLWITQTLEKITA